MVRSDNKMEATASTVGVLVDWLGDPYQASVCEGIEEGAVAAGANLLYFVGGSLPSDPGSVPPSHRVYELARAKTLDGLVLISSTLGHEVGAKGVELWAQQFSNLPLCSVGLSLPGVSSVTTNNESGMVAAVEHLISQHGASRIAFVSGPVENAESNLRHSAYRSVLERSGIRYEADWVTVGNFLTECAAGALAALERQSGLELQAFDAIVAANDNMALGVLAALQARGLNVPADVAIVGFDDIEESRCVLPTLSTVRQPMRRLGLEGWRQLRAGTDTGPPLQDLQIETEFLARQSCGCSTEKVASTGVRKVRAAPSFVTALMVSRDPVCAKLTRVAKGNLAALNAGWEQSVYSSFGDDILNAEFTRFSAEVNGLITRLSADRLGLTSLGAALATLRYEVVPLIQGDPDKLAHAEGMSRTAQQAIGSAVQRALDQGHLRLSRYSRTIAVVCNALSRCREPSALAAAFRKHLPSLGFRSAFICLYDNPGDPSGAQLVTGYDVGGAVERRRGTAFSGSQLLPIDLNASKGRSYAVLPLIDEENLRGHVLFEYTSEHALACGVVADAINIAILAMNRSGATLEDP